MTDEARAARGAYMREWRERNRERLREYSRQWAREHKASVQASAARYWQRKAEVQRGQSD